MESILIKGGLIHDAVNEVPYIADILCINGKITKIQPDIPKEDGMNVIDAIDLWVYPGLVDAHSHIGLDGYGIGFEGKDYNEMNDILTPHLRAIDAINPMDPTLLQAVQGGVTSVATGPGSSNVLGGTFAAIKLSGSRIDNMVIREKIAMKCAFGENPKRVYKDKNNYSRMSTAAKLREILFQAKEYQAKLISAGEDDSKKPAFNMKLEALLPVLNREIPLKAHAHRADDIFTAIRIAKEFDLRLTIEHCTEGHLIVEELAKEGYPVAVGPSLGHATKFELRNKTFTTPGILAKAGLSVSIITDSPVIPEQYLSLCAGLAVKSGMDPFEALKAITINPAKHIGIEDRVGSLTVGKDADIVLTNGNILDSLTNVVKTIIDGRPVEADSSSHSSESCF
ncbi:Imidazolonepropionase [Anaerocolumna jejuensis DSM 15929]|uniref:Imidazolonepropionase n=1 Tax=Anaerocolumna jejuensis DSM 15929 TaxID=1121322 RepID=A0A1M6TFS2_9FIRM|nr:amidohydrolase [Anaerocolumna jejuensis]SHK55724.1 Imidazolonepropionase [Anaerocolumna jejuensis DSM 15929]